MSLRLVAAVLLSASPLLAQESTDVLPSATQGPQRVISTQDEAQKAAEEVRKREVAGAEEAVTYEQVLADPDNVDLNYRYARAQVKKGNLRGAISTLERILTLKPDFPAARLLYAVVLLRAGDLGEAEGEFEKLRSVELPYELRSELTASLRQIRAANRKTRLTATLGGGMEYNDNQNSAPSSGERLFLDTPIILDSDSTRRGDFSKLLLGNLGVIHDFDKKRQVFATLGYYQAEQTQLKTLNIQNYSATLGGVVKTPWADLLPAYEFSHLRLAQATYLRNHEVRLRLARDLGDGVDLFADGSYADQRYNRTEVAPAGDQRTGEQYSGGVGAGVILGSRNRLSLGYAHTDQNAVEAFNAYRRETFALEDTCMLGLGQFLLLSVSGNLDRYRSPDEAISSLFRKDDALRARGTYGLPLGFITRPLDDALLTFTYEYFQAFSNITNYSYTSNRISALVTYKWSAGL